MNRQQRRQAAKEFQAQLASGAVDLAQEFAKPKTITLAYAITEDVRAGFLRSVLACGAAGPKFGFAVRPRDCEHDGNAARAKNLLLKSFLESTEDEYLLFAGTSISFAPQDVAMLIAADSPIAGALYFSAATGAESWPVAWMEADAADDDPDGKSGEFQPVTLPTPPEDFNEEDQEQLEAWMAELSLPIPVVGVGFGLTLIRREVAEKVAATHDYPFEVVADRDEDLVFCVRAADLGYESVVMPAARVGNLRVGML